MLFTFAQPAHGQTMKEKYDKAGELFLEAKTFAKAGTAESMRAALPKFEQALRLLQEINAQREEAICLEWLGFVNNSLGDNQKDMNFEAAVVAPDYKLFSAVQIFEGIAVGSIFTAQIMLASNYAKLGDEKRAKRKLLFSLASPLLCLMLYAVSSGLYLLVTIGFFFKFYYEFKRNQKTKYIEHLANDGAHCSDWDVIGWVILSIIIHLTLYVIIKILLLNAVS
jgi:hypothetical protein